MQRIELGDIVRIAGGNVGTVVDEINEPAVAERLLEVSPGYGGARLFPLSALTLVRRRCTGTIINEWKRRDAVERRCAACACLCDTGCEDDPGDPLIEIGNRVRWVCMSCAARLPGDPAANERVIADVHAARGVLDAAGFKFHHGSKVVWDMAGVYREIMDAAKRGADDAVAGAAERLAADYGLARATE